MIKENDHCSQKLIYQTYFKRVYHASYFIVRDREIAFDVAQETFIKALKKIHLVEDVDKLGAWLSTIASHTAIDYLRKLSRWRATEDALINSEMTKQNYFVSEVEAIVENKRLKELLLEEINRLSPNYKQVLLLRYIHDMSLAEIANTLDINVGTVKTRLYRARTQLRKKLKHIPDAKDSLFNIR